MKLSTASALFLAGVAGTPSAEPIDDGMACSNVTPGITNAIGKFCQKSNMVVPSPYALDGMTSDPEYTDQYTIRITGNCAPVQWVPQQYCISQFSSMCRSLNGGDYWSAHFGRDKCQLWEIIGGDVHNL